MHANKNKNKNQQNKLLQKSEKKTNFTDKRILSIPKGGNQKP